MISTLRTMALAAALVTGACGIALAQGCPPGYMFDGRYCQPAGGPGVVGGAANAAGAIVGGAANTAGAIVGGTVGAVTGAPYYAPQPYYAPTYQPYGR